MLGLFFGHGQPILSEVEIQEAHSVIRKQEPLYFVSQLSQSPPSLLIWNSKCQGGFSPLQGSRDDVVNMAFGSY